MRPGEGKYLSRKYATKIRRYLANAEKIAKEPEGADKAGEIVWGAVVLAVKIRAARIGVKIDTSTEATQFAKKHMSDHDREIVQLVFGLHKSFYGLEESDFEIVFARAKEWIAGVLMGDEAK